jgi:hemolysin activation/secretion protein
VPSQQLTEGIVRIDIIEGSIANVKLEDDDPNDNPALIQAYFDKIRASKPLQVKSLM